MNISDERRPLTVRSIYSIWWPLAASWLMMGLELPAASAVVARLPDPSIHLAAYGGVVFPLSVFIEAPVIMLLAAGYLAGTFPGIVVAASAVSFGVIAEAVYVGIRVRPVVRGPLASSSPPAQPLTRGSFLRFYAPLAVTPLFATLAWTVVSAGLSRMPRALDSLAVWPVLNGLVFTLRSLGFAFNEVVVVALDRFRPRAALVRFTLILMGSVTALLLLVAVTPLARFWFGVVSGLVPELAGLAERGLRIAIPMPAFAVLHSYYQGKLVHARKTREVTEAVALYLGVVAVVLFVSVRYAAGTGLYYGLIAVLAGYLVQAARLRFHCRRAAADTGDRAVPSQ